MQGENTDTRTRGADFENGQALTLPCTSTLHSIPGFDRLSRKRIYPKRTTLFVEGQTARGVYVLCSGRAKLSVGSAHGKTLIVRIARPGDLLGIHATLAGRPYEATVETLAASRIDFITRSDFLGLLGREPSSGLNLAIAISKEATDLVEHARVFLLPNAAPEKLARLLLAWCDAFGQPTPRGTHLKTLLTHQELGQMMGASRETVTRALNLLKRKHMVHASNGDIWIRDRVALTELAKLAP
jgi:CRP/FNR family transcriptional regulator, cyclic AMP receptor protein